MITIKEIIALAKHGLTDVVFYSLDNSNKRVVIDCGSVLFVQTGEPDISFTDLSDKELDRIEAENDYSLEDVYRERDNV